MVANELDKITPVMKNLEISDALFISDECWKLRNCLLREKL